MRRQPTALSHFLIRIPIFQPAKPLELFKSAGAASRLPRAAGTALFASRRGQLRINRRSLVNIPGLGILVIADERRRVNRRAVLGNCQIKVRTGRVAGAADIADRLPLFTSVPTATLLWFFI